MKKHIIKACLLLIFISCSKELAEVSPEIINIGQKSVEIIWKSEIPYTGVLYYKKTGNNTPAKKATEAFGKSYKHKTVLNSLTPGTRYTYWIKETETKYHFQTKPKSSAPFSFILFYGDISSQASALFITEMPEFFLSLDRDVQISPQTHKQIRPFIPILRYNGSMISRYDTYSATNYIDWGSLRLLNIATNEAFTKLLKIPGAHIIGVITKHIPDNPDKIKISALHTLIINYNQNNPSRKIAFVIDRQSYFKQTMVDNVTYVGLKQKNKLPQVFIGTVQDQSIIITPSDSDEEITLKKSGMKTKKSCEECRRLADKGAYKESIKAYRDFIEKNKNHYQIDDAHYAIAEIYDTRLFDFENALLWYNKLITTYPDSSLTAISKQRISYINQYSHYDFKPLAAFEYLRKKALNRSNITQKERFAVLENALKIIEKYPDGAINADIYYWVANQYKDIDLDKAIHLYKTLASTYPDNVHAKEIFWEIGNALYNNENFHDAITAFKKAKKTNSHLAADVDVQINRAKRNIRRDMFAITSVIIIITMFILALFISPFGFKKVIVLRTAIASLFLFLLCFLSGLLIYEQFSSITEIFLLALAGSLSSTVGFLFSATIADNLLKNNLFIHKTAAILLNLLFFICLFYTAIYYINSHLLIVFGL